MWYHLPESLNSRSSCDYWWIQHRKVTQSNLSDVLLVTCFTGGGVSLRSCSCSLPDSWRDGDLWRCVDGLCLCLDAERRRLADVDPWQRAEWLPCCCADARCRLGDADASRPLPRFTSDSPRSPCGDLDFDFLRCRGDFLLLSLDDDCAPWALIEPDLSWCLDLSFLRGDRDFDLHYNSTQRMLLAFLYSHSPFFTMSLLLLVLSSQPIFPELTPC